MRHFLFFLLFVSLSTFVHAQETTCPAIAEQALQQLGDNCTDIERNSACYGFDLVNTTFNQPIEVGFFSQPSDITDLSIVDFIETAPMDITSNQWGIAIMKIQADIPNTLPGQAVTFLLMGDARIQNAVPVDEMSAPTTISVNVAQEAVVLSEPDANSTLLGTVAAGTNIEVDVLDPTGTWARFTYLDNRAWINRADLGTTDALDALPNGSFTPMQAFYFTTGVSAPACNEAPSVIAINSPDNMTINLNINGADVRIGSTVVLYNTAPDQAVYTVMEGQMEIMSSGVKMEAGQSMTATLEAETGEVLSWSNPAPMSSDEMSMHQVIVEAMGVAGVEIDTSTTAAAETTETIHIVATGETLFSIARLYDASMPAIVDRNGLDDPRTIRVGDRLMIPNPGSGFIALESSTSPATQQPGVNIPIPPSGDVISPPQPQGTAIVDCNGLRPTSPLSGLAYGNNTFYWDGIPGVDSYRLVVHNREEGRTLTRDTGQTSITANIDQPTLGGGFNFRWWVQALRQGEVVCTSTSFDVQRAAQGSGDPAAPPVNPPIVQPPPFSANWVCAGPDTIIISYNGAANNDTVQITYQRKSLSGTIVGTVQLNPAPQVGSSGSIVESFPEPSEFLNGAVTTTSGLSAPILPATITCP